MLKLLNKIKLQIKLFSYTASLYFHLEKKKKKLVGCSSPQIHKVFSNKLNKIKIEENSLESNQLHSIFGGWGGDMSSTFIRQNIQFFFIYYFCEDIVLYSNRMNGYLYF